MTTQTVTTKLVVDASGVLRGVDAYGRAMTTAAAATARTGSAADQLQAKLASQRKLLEAGVPVLTSRAAAVSREERAWQSLAAKTNPLLALSIKQQRERERAIVAASNAALAGYASEEQALAAVTALEAQHKQALESYGKVAGAASFQTSNIAAQFQDIAVQLQAGQSPFQIALQQGTQLSSALGTKGGLSAALGSLAAGFGALLSPVSLATVGVIAFGGLAVQALGNILPKSETATDALKRHADAIGDIVKGYDAAGDAIDDFVASAERLPREAVQIKLSAEFGQMEREAAAFIDQARSLGPVLGGSLNEADRQMGELLQSFGRGELSARDLYVELTRIENTDFGPLGFGIRGLAADLADGALKAAAMRDAFVGLAHAIAATGQNGGLQIALDSKLAGERSAMAHQIELDALKATTPEALADIARRRKSLELMGEQISESLRLQEISQAGELAFAQAATAQINLSEEDFAELYGVAA